MPQGAWRAWRKKDGTESVMQPVWGPGWAAHDAPLHPGLHPRLRNTLILQIKLGV